MRRLLIGIVVSIVALPALADNGEDIVLRGMGSFHVGGRSVEITGKPIKEMVFAVGGVPARIDPNGLYQVEQMYVQYFLPKNRKGKLPLLMWHGGGLTGVTYETTPDGREGWLNMFIRKGCAGARGLPARMSGRAIRIFSPRRTRSSASASAPGRARGTSIRPSATCCPATSSRSRPTRISSSRSCRAGSP